MHMMHLRSSPGGSVMSPPTPGGPQPTLVHAVTYEYHNTHIMYGLDFKNLKIDVWCVYYTVLAKVQFLR